MSIIPQTDQWKLDGNCEKCRRHSYCGSLCRLHKIRMKILAAKEHEKDNAAAQLDKLTILNSPLFPKSSISEPA
jgi:sulfatase maturation enzyme AslB (radical SAM superfamily)